MKSAHHTQRNAAMIIQDRQNPSDSARPPQRTRQDRNGGGARTLADDLNGEPDSNTGTTEKPPAKPITPGEYLIRLCPQLAERYGVPLVETFIGRDEADMRLRIEALEEEFFARYLGREGSPAC